MQMTACEASFVLLINKIVQIGGLKVFHRPHPQKEADKGAVKSVRRFLTESGIEP